VLYTRRETEPNFHLDIQEDVTEECAKYGKVLQCHVVRDSPSGLVYLKFESTDGGTPLSQTAQPSSLRSTFWVVRCYLRHHTDPQTFLVVRTATKAIQALNGRWFAGKVISAEFIDENTFLAGCKL
jgi:hypothetical protein